MKRLLAVFLSLLMLSALFALPAEAYAASKPAKPSLSAAYALSKTKIKLKWKKAKNAKKYTIYRSTKYGSGYKKIATVSKTEYTAGGLKKKTKYYFKIKAVNGKKTSAYSNIKAATTHKSYNKEKLNKLFFAVADKAINQYGYPSLEKSAYSHYDNTTDYYVKGVSLIDFRDLNNDGMPEMILIYNNNVYRADLGDGDYETEFDWRDENAGFFIDVYASIDSKAKRVLHKFCNMGGSFSAYFYYATYKRYGITYIKEDGGGDMPYSNYWRYSNHKMVAEEKYEMRYNVKTDNVTFLKNNKKISMNKYYELVSDRRKGVTNTPVSQATKKEAQGQLDTTVKNYNNLKKR